MDFSLLIATPNDLWGNDVKENLEKSGYQSEVVNNGKDCQLRLAKRKFQAILLDIGLQNHSSFEVLKFLKFVHPSVKILLLMKNKSDLEAIPINSISLHKTGISDLIHIPHTLEKIKKCLNDIRGFESWKGVTQAKGQHEEVSVKAKDSDFTSINIAEFYSSNITVFDHYIRLGQNNFKKILHQGDVFEPDRIKKYESDGVKLLYIRTSDRLNYINFINDLVKNTLQKSNDQETTKLILPLKSITIKYMEEVYTAGLKPHLVEEGKSICQNMYDYIKKDPPISKILHNFEQTVPSALNHSFLVSFFSVFICRHLDWAGIKTVEAIAIGALLHDVGILGLPVSIRDIKESDLSPKQIQVYREHPKLAIDLLKKTNVITEQVMQIIYEHHENIDGSGYPNQISGTKIYPLAKIVALSDSFSELIMEVRSPPKDALKEFLKSRDLLNRHDPLLVKALAKGIIDNE